MSTKPHYFAIGIFVIGAVALGLIGVVLFASDAMRAPERFLETYIDESVQGIDVGTPFKLRGVKVGNVSEVAMVSAVYDTKQLYVMIRVALDEDAIKIDAKAFELRVKEQIEKGLRLKLVPQGITGLSFVEADFFPNTDADPLEMDWNPKYTYVPSTPSTMSLISRSLERLSAELDTINLAEIGSNVQALTSNLNVTVMHIEELAENVATASGEVVENVRKASDDLPTITSNLKKTTQQLEAMLNASDRDVNQIMDNLRYITDDARELIRMLKRHPGMLLAEPPNKKIKSGGNK